MRLLYNISFLYLIIHFIAACSQSADKDNLSQNNNENLNHIRGFAAVVSLKSQR